MPLAADLVLMQCVTLINLTWVAQLGTQPQPNSRVSTPNPGGAEAGPPERAARSGPGADAQPDTHQPGVGGAAGHAAARRRRAGRGGLLHARTPHHQRPVRRARHPGGAGTLSVFRVSHRWTASHPMSLEAPWTRAKHLWKQAISLHESLAPQWLSLQHQSCTQEKAWPWAAGKGETFPVFHWCFFCGLQAFGAGDVESLPVIRSAN